jgi:hypothetical protein
MFIASRAIAIMASHFALCFVNFQRLSEEFEALLREAFHWLLTPTKLFLAMDRQSK